MKRFFINTDALVSDADHDIITDWHCDAVTFQWRTECHAFGLNGYVAKRRPNNLPADAPLWQLPQGGIDAGEAPQIAAFRELAEETGIRSAKLIYELPDWLRYDLPENLIGTALKGRFRGQKQKWFAMQFTASDDEIDLAAHDQI